MLYRIIDKKTKLFIRDDFFYNKETEEAITVEVPQGFKKPKWVELIETDNETEVKGFWEEGENND